MLDDVLQTLTEQLIKENFNSKTNNSDKYIITKEELIKFSIKLINVIKEVYEVERQDK